MLVHRLRSMSIGLSMSSYKIGFFLSDTIWEGGFNYITNMCESINIAGKHSFSFYYFVSQSFPRDKKDILLSIDNAYLVSSDKVNLVFSFKYLLLSLFSYNIYANYFVKLFKIDLVYEFSPYLGINVPYNLLTWVPDLQHKELPQNFSLFYRLRREIQYILFAKFRQTIHLNSKHSKKLFCEYYKPDSNTISLPFTVLRCEQHKTLYLQKNYLKYNLPDNYFFLPNQFWKHKNHIVVLKAVLDLKIKGIDTHIVMTGAKNDLNGSLIYDRIVSFISEYDLAKNIFILGKIPYLDTISILIHSRALINPSLYEGWSTTVEEAKSYNLPIVLSDIPVHREQTPKNRLFFNPISWKDLSNILFDLIKTNSTRLKHKSLIDIKYSENAGKVYGKNLKELFSKVIS